MAAAPPPPKRPRRAAAHRPGRDAQTTPENNARRLAEDPLAGYRLPRTIALRPPPPRDKTAQDGDITVTGTPGGVSATSGALDARLRAATGASLTPAERTWALRAIEHALRPMYDRTPAMRWSTAEKRRELRAAEQQFLLVFPSGKDQAAYVSDAASGETCAVPNTPLGFVSYRMDHYDEDMPPSTTPVQSVASQSFSADSPSPAHALYVYELYVSEGARGRGIGLTLMKLLEMICSHAHVGRIVLTVFDENVAAMGLYKQCLGYVVDRSSPCQWGIRDAGYQILSKSLFH
jgi:ribosomal protein S18 acetylase RimI-like enzyme